MQKRGKELYACRPGPLGLGATRLQLWLVSLSDFGQSDCCNLPKLSTNSKPLWVTSKAVPLPLLSLTNFFSKRFSKAPSHFASDRRFPTSFKSLPLVLIMRPLANPILCISLNLSFAASIRRLIASSDSCGVSAVVEWCPSATAELDDV